MVCSYGCRAVAAYARARARSHREYRLDGGEGWRAVYLPPIRSESGVIAFTKALAKELATDGVTVNAIAPEMAETDLMKEMTPEHIASMKAKIPMGRSLQIPEVGGLVAFIVGPDCTFTTGFTFDLSGGRTTY